MYNTNFLFCKNKKIDLYTIIINVKQMFVDYSYNAFLVLCEFYNIYFEMKCGTNYGNKINIVILYNLFIYLRTTYYTHHLNHRVIVKLLIDFFLRF